MPRLKVVCLISGGKDSLFSILHCQQNGHQVVALANLHPPVPSEEDAEEDMDSYMYQTVGHKIIPLYGQALGLPLYRQEIVGSAVNHDKSYTETGEVADETESLLPLLRKVLQHHPDVDAVSTGAILSDYQRTRVESVAIRLGLVPLSYLWQWPTMPPHTQKMLLEDMHAAGQDSRIIKVASGGLDSSFLWCNVADMRVMHRLDAAVKRFGSGEDGAVLGEGGEYETLAVAGPAPLWKGRIEVGSSDLETIAGEAGSASIRINEATVVEQSTEVGFGGVRVPRLLEPTFENLLAVINDGNIQPSTIKHSPTPTGPLADHVCLEGLCGTPGQPVSEQMESIMQRDVLAEKLATRETSLGVSNIAYVSIVLRDMKDFAAVNAIYIKAFIGPNPPARITLADPAVLSPGQDVMVSLTCYGGGVHARQGLHVQSQSYWAPANIGPYSQAISVPVDGKTDGNGQRMVYIAGQIPLIPASMEMATPEAASGDLAAFAKQAVLAAQHFVRIGRAMRVRAWACGIACITAESDSEAEQKAEIARRTWPGLHWMSVGSQSDDADADTDDEAFDIWDVKHGTQRATQRMGDFAQLGARTGRTDGKIPALEVIRVDALPRNASIEWATYGLTVDGAPTPRVPHFEHLLEVFGDRIIR